MPKGTRLDTDTQLQILALLARGDTHKQIAGVVGVSEATVKSVRERNPAALTVIQERMMDHKITSSRKILSKAHGLIERKLDKIMEAEVAREDASARLRSGEIDFEGYKREVMGLIDATLPELNTVAKEAFNQSQIEAGKPTSISSATGEAKEDLLRLAEALRAGDEERLSKIIFSERDAIEAEITDPLETTDETHEPERPTGEPLSDL